ncbi:ATP-dependent helicase [Roseibacillus ishigakijimensis]|uniref:DNA 3'-5' helicase n=1 Tax=Roseibacillus ishigakijimensis TaxID=454146 RepID=A0A934RMV6_9BACT|nr:ATP-dependent helicase [Roseibacillus ishigakijimensis]MBK1834314.1 ATP-dependent helicase [Roseibacillus ishigakijimensis]
MARNYQLNQPERKGTSGIDYRAALNDEQYAAVTSPPGAALVIAGAGSGKTRTLTYRVAFLLDQGVDPKDILLLTFTNKASREMLERVKELVPRDLSTLWGGTFHSIGNRILRRHADELGFTRSFSILDRDDQKSLLNTVVAECEIDTKVRRFPKADVLATIFSIMQNTGETLEEVLESRYSYFGEWGEEIARIAERYTSKKQEVNSMDFDDLLVLTLRLLQENEELRHLYQKRFRYVLVDEFQDTNHVQSELIALLVERHKSLMVVGDDAQSIYSWRGADMENILGFPDRFEGAKVFKIETNYRSVPEILNLSNEAIRANTRQFAKTLRSSRAAGSAPPALVPVEDPTMQAHFVAQRILELRDEGVELEEMAILYRAHHQSMEVQLELTNRGIPFQVTSGLRFFEQAHIKDVAAFIRLVVNRRDEVSFKRLVMLLPGIGAKGAEKLWAAWQKTGWGTQDKPPAKFSEKLLEFSVAKKARPHWEQLAYVLDELVTGEDFARPSAMIYSILEGLYDGIMQSNFENYEQRRADVEQLMTYGEGFDDVEEFLAQLSLMSSVDGEPTGKRDEIDGEQVTLSSIHQAKGLEYKVVFVIWLTEGMFPNGRIIDSGDEAQMEEERRLFYVAITRAKDELYLLYPQLNPRSYSGEILQQPSRFLEDCPAELMEEWRIGGSSPW